jgi:hypothetical protein
MTYSIVAWAAMSTECSENTIVVLLFMGRRLVTGGCCDYTVLTLSEYVYVYVYLNQWSLHAYTACDNVQFYILLLFSLDVLQTHHRQFISQYSERATFNIKRQSYRCNMPWRPIGLWDVEAPTFSLDNRLTDGGEVVSLTRRPPLYPQEDSWYSFLLEAESTPGP